MQTGHKTIVKNEMELAFDAISVNESFARVAVAAFVAPLNPTMEEISDIRVLMRTAGYRTISRCPVCGNFRRILT